MEWQQCRSWSDCSWRSSQIWVCTACSEQSVWNFHGKNIKWHKQTSSPTGVPLVLKTKVYSRWTAKEQNTVSKLYSGVNFSWFLIPDLVAVLVIELPVRWWLGSKRVGGRHRGHIWKQRTIYIYYFKCWCVCIRMSYHRVWVLNRTGLDRIILV